MPASSLLELSERLNTTPSVGVVYDRTGNNSVFTQGAITTTWSRNGGGQALSEGYLGGPLDGMSVTNGYDGLGRRAALAVLNSNTAILQYTSTYDDASRLSSVSDGTNWAAYFYLSNSALVDHIVFASNATTVMTTSNKYDFLNRLVSVSSVSSASSAVNFQYQYNAANQRTAVTNGDGSYWVYGYDSLGQVTNAVKKWPDNTVVAGQQFGFGFDTIGNRRMTLAGGDQNGANQRQAGYSANSLNEYTSRTVPGAVDIIGSATNTASVWVDQTPAYRKTNYFWFGLPVSNTAGAAYPTVTTLAALTNGYGTNPAYGSTNIGHVFVPQTPESYSYDADGYMTGDGRWSYGWDAENRLTNMTSQSGAPSASLLKLDFTYDYLCRRIQKIVSTNNGTSYQASYTNKFVYDGWNVVAILDGTNNPLYSFVWGKDLSGSMQGAGGVGGLISMTVHSGANAGTYFYCYDGNGNVVALVNAANGAIAAQYEYGPFGEVIRATGPMTKVNPFMFSTKFYDWESGLYYYDYRYYNPSTGRWIGRDPAGERGGMSLYGFVGNNPVSSFDLLGLLDYYLGNTDPTYTPPPTGQTPIAPTVALRAFWLTVDVAASYAALKYPHAAAFLVEYLEGDGSPVTTSVDAMLHDSSDARDVYRRELTQAEKFAATLAKKPNGDYDIDSRTLSLGTFLPSDSMDWFLAIGRYAAWGKGKAHVKDCTVTLDFTYEFKKRYQWQVDQDKVTQPLKQFGINLTITDAQMGELSEAGLAKEYDITGEKSQTVNATDANETGPNSPPRTGR